MVKVHPPGCLCCCLSLMQRIFHDSRERVDQREDRESDFHMQARNPTWPFLIWPLAGRSDIRTGVDSAPASLR